MVAVTKFIFYLLGYEFSPNHCKVLYEQNTEIQKPFNSLHA